MSSININSDDINKEGFLSGETASDVHLLAIPLIPKNMEKHYAIFYGKKITKEIVK